MENRLSVGRRECQGLILTELELSGPKLLPPPRVEPAASFCLVLDGEYLERRAGRTITHGPFTVRFQLPENEHFDEAGARGAHLFHIELSSDWTDRLRRFGAASHSALDSHGGDLVWLALRLYLEFTALPDARAALACEGIVLEMLAAVGRYPTVSSRTPPKWLTLARDRIHSDFLRNPNLDELAQAAGVHPVHLSRVFKRWEGQTLSEYHQRLRLQFACRQLTSGCVSLAEVSRLAGFSDQSHFTHVFRSVTGLTPSIFRSALPDSRHYAARRAPLGAPVERAAT
jgi:AraC family transcriptional regulator